MLTEGAGAYTLCLDVGNTNTKVALYAGARPVATWRVATGACRRAAHLALWLRALLEHRGFRPDQVRQVGVASVVPPVDGEIVAACRSLFDLEPMFVSSALALPVSLAYENPKALGADRIANVAAAAVKYGVPAIVVDCGTATKVEAISADRVHLGGAIMPGRQISLDALRRRTSSLPRVPLTPLPVRIPQDTAESLQLGAALGLVGAVSRLVAEARRIVGAKARVVHAGGLAHLFRHLADEGAVFDPNLTLDGVRAILALNEGGGDRPSHFA